MAGWQVSYLFDFLIHVFFIRSVEVSGLPLSRKPAVDPPQDFLWEKFPDGDRAGVGQT